MTDERTDGIGNFLSGLGIEGTDSGASSRPMRRMRLQPYELELLYSDNDLAAIIVDEIVEESLRGGFEVKVAGEPEALLVDELYRLKVNARLIEAAKMSRLYGAAFLWLIVDDGIDITQPLEPEKVKALTQLIPIDQYEVGVEAWQEDRTAEGYGEPMLYRLNTGEVIHESRLLKFVGEKMPRKIARSTGEMGSSVLHRCWDSIRRFSDVETAASRIIQSFEQSTISISGLAQIASSREGAGLIERRMRMIARSRSIINTVLLDRDAGEEFTQSSSSVAGLPELRDRFAESVAKAARMPLTILFSQAPAGLNTDGASGIASWHKRCASFQSHELTPQLDILISLIFAIQGNSPEEWLVAWPPLEEATEAEIAATRKLVAETDAIYLDRGVRSPDQVSQSRDGGAEFSMETQAPDEDETYQNMLAMMEGGDGQLPEGD